MQEILKYQELDSKIRKLELELASSKNRKGATEMQQYLKDGQAKLIKLEGVAENLSKQYEKAVSLYKEFIEKIEKLAKSIDELDNGKSTDLDNILNNYINTSETLENNINALAGKLSAANKEVEVLMNNAKKAKHNLEIFKTNYGKEREKFEPEIIKLKEELVKQKTKVSPSLLSKYLTKAEGKLFPIYVQEAKGRCSGCRMEISASKLSALNSGSAIECENCGRFIYKV